MIGDGGIWQLLLLPWEEQFKYCVAEMNRQKSKPRLPVASNDSAANNPAVRSKQIQKSMTSKRSEATPVPSRPPSRQPTYKPQSTIRSHKKGQSKGKLKNKTSNSTLLMKQDLKQLIGKKGSMRGKPTPNVPVVLSHIEKNFKILRDLHHQEQQNHAQAGQKRGSHDGKHSQFTNRSHQAAKKMHNQRDGEGTGDKKRAKIVVQSTRLSLDCHKPAADEHNIIEVFKYYKMAVGEEQQKQTKQSEIKASRSSSLLHGPSVNIQKIQEMIRNQQQMMKQQQQREKKERPMVKRSEMQRERRRREGYFNVNNQEQLRNSDMQNEFLDQQPSFCMQSLRPLQPQPTPIIPPHRHIPLPEEVQLFDRLLQTDPQLQEEEERRFAQSKYYVRPIPSGKEDSLLGCQITLVEKSQQRLDSDLPYLDL